MADELPGAMMRRLAILSLALSGCTTELVSDSGEPSLDPLPPSVNELAAGTDPASPEEIDPGLQVEEQPFTPLAADMCDDPAYSDVTWKTQTSPHFVLTFPGYSAPDTDRAEIVARLEAAYSDIRTQLGITAEPQLYVNLSPNRIAAQANNKGMGRVWPSLARYDAVYTGATDSYERVRYGKLMTAVLDYYTDSMNRYRMPVLATGVAELMDQSARNLHDEYAKLLLAGVESRVRIAELDAGDVFGENTGRAGSLVQFLVDRYGMQTFVDIYRATNVVWNGSCYEHSPDGCLDTPEKLTALLDSTISARTGESWATLQPLWRAQVDDALARVSVDPGSDARAEVENLLKVMDSAITNDNAALYRTTIEGFYCDWGGDTERDEISARAVAAYGSMSTQLLALYDTGIKNFATASAFVMRVADGIAPRFETIYLEHVPAGWRVSYSEDWY